MTATERSEMRSMVQFEDYRHLSVGSIARLASRLGKVKTGTTAELLREAAKGLPDRTVPSAVMDSGVENVNGSVNELVSDGTIAL
jgi:hypothetical protein